MRGLYTKVKREAIRTDFPFMLGGKSHRYPEPQVGRETGIRITAVHWHRQALRCYGWLFFVFSLASVQFSSVAQSCPTLCDSMNHSTPGLPVHHQLLELTQTHVHQVSHANQPSHPLSSPSLPALNLSQHQGLLKWVSSPHQVAKVLEF